MDPGGGADRILKQRSKSCQAFRIGKEGSKIELK